MRGWLPRALSATVVVAAMLAQATVCHGACPPCGNVATAQDAAGVHSHDVASRGVDAVDPAAATHHHYAGLDVEVASSDRAASGCCCATMSRAGHTSPVGAPALGLTTIERGHTAPAPWVLPAATAWALATETRARRTTPATLVARPPLILRI